MTFTVVVLDLLLDDNFLYTFERSIALDVHLVKLVERLAADGMYLRVQCQEFRHE